MNKPLLVFSIIACSSNVTAMNQQKIYDAQKTNTLRFITQNRAFYIAEVERLVTAGADPNICVNVRFQEWSLLRFAVETESDSLVTLLLDRGANPNDATNPLEAAVKIGNSKIIAELKKAKADLANDQK